MICSLKFKKDVIFLKMILCFRFCAFDCEAISHPSCYLSSILDKTHYGLVITPFSVQILQYFSYAGSGLVSESPTVFLCYWLI